MSRSHSNRGKAWEARLLVEHDRYRRDGLQIMDLVEQQAVAPEVALAIAVFDDAIWLGTKGGLLRVDPTSADAGIERLLESPEHQAGVADILENLSFGLMFELYANKGPYGLAFRSNFIVGYLAAVSRKLERPLAIVILKCAVPGARSPWWR